MILAYKIDSDPEDIEDDCEKGTEMSLFGGHSSNGSQLTYSDFAGMLIDIKQNVAAAYVLASQIDESYRKVNGSYPDPRLLETMQVDLVAYMLYLSAADGHIDTTEVDTINTFLGMSFSRSQCEEIARETGLYSGTFETRIPPSFALLHSLSLSMGEGRELGDAIIGLYGQLGALVVIADGEVDSSEERKFNSYLDRLKTYL